VGLSFSLNKTDYSTNDTQTARDSHAVLRALFSRHPQLQANDFYISGETLSDKGGKHMAGLCCGNTMHQALPPSQYFQWVSPQQAGPISQFYPRPPSTNSRGLRFRVVSSSTGLVPGSQLARTAEPDLPDTQTKKVLTARHCIHSKALY
jgi:hypothetical protein